jgi:molybdopterin-guanine dinucleotide biosynthesis protein A
MKYTAVITAKKQSNRLPNKNWLMIERQPMVARSIKHAMGSSVDYIVVVTDCPRIRTLAERMGVEVIEHPEYELGHKAAIEAGNLFDTNVVLLQPSSPFRSKGLVDKCIEQHRENGGTVMTKTSKENPVGCVYVFDKDDVCDYSNTTYVEIGHVDALEIDYPRDYIDACQLASSEKLPDLISPVYVKRLQDCLLHDQIQIVVRESDEPRSDIPTCYVNHCLGYDGGRADILCVVANQHLMDNINTELLSVLKKCEHIIIRESNRTNEFIQKYCQGKKITRFKTSKHGVTTGTAIKWLFEKAGVDVKLIGYGPICERQERLSELADVSIDVAYFCDHT